METPTVTAGGWIGFLGQGLAPRELEAIAHAANELTVKQISRAMGISPCTAAKRLDSAKFKLGVKTVRGLVLEAFRRGLIVAAGSPFPADPNHQQDTEHQGVLVA